RSHVPHLPPFFLFSLQRSVAHPDLHSFPTRRSSDLGPMDRVTASRNMHHVPHRIARMALDGLKRVRVNTLDAVGDYIHAEDIERSEEHTSELQSPYDLVCRLLLEKKNNKKIKIFVYE